jgi:cytochrome P450
MADCHCDSADWLDHPDLSDAWFSPSMASPSARRSHQPVRPPGPSITLPMLIAGFLFPKRFPFDPLRFGLDNARQFGDIVYYQVGPLRVYQLNHPDLARQVLVDQADKFYKPQLLKRAFRPFAGGGLLTSDGALWKQQRKLIQPAFHPSQMPAYAAVMVTHTERMLATFRNGAVIDVGETMSKLTMGIVVKTLFGTDFTKEANEVAQLMGAVLEGANQRLNSPLSPPAWLPTKRHRRERRSLTRLDAMLVSMIDARRASTEHRQDLLSVLLAARDEDSQQQMSDRQLRDEMMTLFLAGHETTATAMTWIWYLLSQHPASEARLIEELDRVLGDRVPSVADLPSLPLTEMIVREALRLYSPVAGVAREPIEDVSILGYTVPKGSLVTVNSHMLHRDERFFDHPDTFDPDRFSGKWEERIPRYAYLPFGGGPRVCIGNGFAMMEARLILATVAQRFRLSLEPGQDIVPMQLVTVRPKNGLKMKLHKRSG